MTAAAWVRPTVRAVPWQPLGAVATASIAATALVRSLEGRPASTAFMGVLAAALATAVVAGLRDPAAALLAASPTPALRRTLHRVAVLTVPTLLVWALAAALAAPPRGDAGSPGPLVALAAAGVAVATWVRRPQRVVLGAALPLLWFGAAHAAGDLDGALPSLARLPGDHPWPLAALAGAAVLAGRRRLEYSR